MSVRRRPRIWNLPERRAVVAVTERLTRVGRVTVTRTLHRATYLEFLSPPAGATPEPLHYRGSLAGRRYTPRGGPAGLYLAFDPATPTAELRAVVFEHGFPVSSRDHDPIVTIAVRAQLHRIVDLTDAETLAVLELRQTDLKADWERGQERYLAGKAPMPATQMLALAAYESALFAGIIYPSARTDFGVNLVVFPDRLDPRRGDLLEVVDSSGRLQQRLP